MLLKMLILLQLSGNIELNPGLVKWPCILCSKPVRSNQDSVECSNCATWCHHKCKGMSLAEYNRQSNCDDEWLCRQCVLSGFSDSLFSFDSCDFYSDSSVSSPGAAVPGRETHEPPRDVSRYVSYISFNSRSIVNKRFDLFSLFTMNKLDIVSICETFLDGAILDSEVVPPGYTVYRCDRNRHGGGLLVAVTVLDLVFTNCETDIKSTSVHTNNSISDHYLISVTISFNFACSKNKPAKYVYDYSKADYEGLCHYLLSCDFTSYFNCTDVNEAWSIIKQLITTGMDLFIPKVRLRSSQYPKWFTSHLRHQVKCLRTLRRTLKRHFSIPVLQQLIHAEDSLQLELLTAKSNHEKNLVNNFVRYKDPKIFHYIKNMNKTNSIPSVLQHNSILVETDKEKAEMFNHYFYSIFTESAFDLLNINELPEQSSLIADISFSPEIFEVLSTLQTTKASGADNIGPSVLKSCAATLTPPLHFLFSLSLKKQRGSFKMEVPYNHTSFQIR